MGIFGEIFISEMHQQIAKPFLKWAGGKTQLISSIKAALPTDFSNRRITFIEPFIGSGAVLFWMMETFPNIEKAVINDINSDLINTYKVIKESPDKLIVVLREIQQEYYNVEAIGDEKKQYYSHKRDLYNSRTASLIEQAALFIFLNRTCFNGLYRVNKSNKFNVPLGSYTKPKILDELNIKAVSAVLQKVEILNGDYQETLNHVGDDTFFYFDPPYKPLSSTSNFNSYANDDFDDNEQIRLRNFCQSLDELGCYWMLSNSDVKGNDANNTFFDDIYQDFNIQRVQAKRMINAKADKRGELTELLITNYQLARQSIAI